jgi:putative DNA primase/helicase
MSFDLHEAARGRWRGILSHFGLDQRAMSGKHGPCPMCGGEDRWRFDDKGGRGTWICNACGAGTGIDLVMKLRGYDFREALEAVKPLVGLTAAEDIKSGMSDERKRELRQQLWKESVPVRPGDPVDEYLRNRGVDQGIYPRVLRFHKACRYAEGVTYPAMIAAVQDADGKGVSLHRSFILDGYKAPVDTPRMLMPGSIPPGSAVRLAEIGDGTTIGIAEGIETALAASDRFSVPTWAALTAGLLADWEPPSGVTEVVIFGDNDHSFTGQAAAYQLAKRLKSMKGRSLSVSVHIPPEAGTDWNDLTKKP